MTPGRPALCSLYVPTVGGRCVCVCEWGVCAPDSGPYLSESIWASKTDTTADTKPNICVTYFIFDEVLFL